MPFQELVKIMVKADWKKLKNAVTDLNKRQRLN